MKNLGPVSGLQDCLVPTLGTWHANLIYVARSPLVLCVNDRSLLSVIVPGRQFPNILSAITARIGERLRRMGLSEELLLQEQAAMKGVEVRPTNSKSVLGSMNDFVHALQWRGRDWGGTEALDELEDILSATPMGALNYQYPIEVAYQVFGIIEQKCWDRGNTDHIHP